MTNMAVLTSADVDHIMRITNDIDHWDHFRKINQTGSALLMPDYLLVAYAKNILLYREEKRLSARSFQLGKIIEKALNKIYRVVMSNDFENIEIRMEIIRIYHDADFFPEKPEMLWL